MVNITHKNMESSPWPENPLAHLKILIKELHCGQEFTNRLREVIKKPQGNGCTNTMVAEDLVEKIMDSFCKTLSILNSNEFNEDSQVPVVISPLRKGGRTSPEDLTGSCKTSSLKDGRGCNKKRKISETSIKETSALLDDGHVWRKYGQKQILDSPYPRNYYRCTNKFDQGCAATKQVQRIQAKPPRFRTTYQGHHTCRTYPTASKILLDSSTDCDSTVLLSFDSNVNSYQTYFPSFPSIKKETKEEVSLSGIYPCNNQNKSSSTNYFITCNDYLTPTAETPNDIVEATLTSGSGNVDFISSGSVHSSFSSTSSHSMEMEIDMLVMRSFDFDDFPFGFEG